MKFYEHKKRSIVKAIVYRPVSSVITFVVLYLVTNSIVQMTLYSLLIESLKITWYFIHERIWNRIQRWKYSG